MDILFKNDHFVFSYRVGGILSGSNTKGAVNPHKHWALGSQIPDLIAK